MKVCSILASGNGSRMGGGGMLLPKQFLNIGNQPMILWTLQAVMNLNIFDCIYVGIHPEHMTLWENIKYKSLSSAHNVVTVTGDSVRMKTFFNTYQRFQEDHHDKMQDAIFCLMDANRPFVPKDIYDRCMEMAQIHGISCPAYPVIDGICLSKDGQTIDAIPDKGMLYHIQTPEYFLVSAFEKALTVLGETAKSSYLAICEIFVAAGYKPFLVHSTEACYKITTTNDLKLANLLAESYCQ